MSFNGLLREVKGMGEDFEIYPTTEEIIEAMYNDIKKQDGMNYSSKTILDIGAGYGKLFSTFKNIAENETDERKRVTINKAYAIEKSRTLINAMPADVFVVGCDFWHQSLIDKKVDIIYSNPPYSMYSSWTEKIIKEANCQTIYLTIPKRWGGQRNIANAIKLREARVRVVGNFSFEESEDRKARAVVSLVRIDLYRESRHSYYREPKTNPFKIWFDEVFRDIENDEDTRFAHQKEEEKRNKLHELVKGPNLIERLEELYNNELTHLFKNYKSVTELDSALLKEMNIDKKQLMEGLELRIKGVKTLFWKELFDNYTPITSRLTEKSRKSIIDTLMENVSIDFTIDNAYSVTIWAIKNANKHYDSQLLDLYMDLTGQENIRLYKSNQRHLNDDWRYLKKNLTHYSLDYRIVHYFFDAIATRSYESVSGMGRNAASLVQDIVTIATNLGFSTPDTVSSFRWEAGKKNVFEMRDPKDPEEWIPLMEVKAFKNGNLHFKLNQQFMKAFNMEAARLNKWIKSPQEACEEFDISYEEAEKYFGRNFTLTENTLLGLLPAPTAA